MTRTSFARLALSSASLVFGAVLSASAPAQNIPGAVAHWSFDDGTNPTHDVVGGHDGSVVGDTFSTDGAPMPGCGQSLLDSSDTGYVDVANSAALSFGATDPFTIALWFKETGGQTVYHILGKRVGCGANSIGINYQISSDLSSGIAFNSEIGGIISTFVQPQGWTHVAVTYDGSQNLIVYVGGGQAASSSSYTVGGANSTDLLIGGSGTCGGNITGNIDEVWMFNRALTQSEVQLLAANNPGTYCTAKVNSTGCTPSIRGTGSTSVSGPDNFYITADSVLPFKTGIMIWSGGWANAPLGGGTRCVASPYFRTPAQNSGSNPPPIVCSGAYSFHFSHAYMAAHGLGVGSTIYAQYWSRDPGFAAPNNVGLTDGLQVVLCP